MYKRYRGRDKGRPIARLVNRAGFGDMPMPTDVELPAATTFFKNLGAFHLSPPPSCSDGTPSSVGRAQATLPQRAHDTFFTRPICIFNVAFVEEDEVEERVFASRKRVAIWRSSRVSCAWRIALRTERRENQLSEGAVSRRRVGSLESGQT